MVDKSYKPCYVSLFFSLSATRMALFIYTKSLMRSRQGGVVCGRKERKKKNMDETASEFLATVHRQNVLSRAH